MQGQIICSSFFIPDRLEPHYFSHVQHFTKNAHYLNFDIVVIAELNVIHEICLYPMSSQGQFA